MKITNDELRKIIREEAESMLDVEHPSEIEPVENVWGGDLEGEGKNLEHPLDHANVHTGGDQEVQPEPEMLPSATPVMNNEGYKITKRQLARIIREEREKLLNEYTPADVSGSGPYSGPGNIEEEIAALEDVLNSLMVAGRNLPAPMDMRIKDAVEMIEGALDRLYGR